MSNWVEDSSFFSEKTFNLETKIHSKIKETDKNYEIDFILPGFKRNEINVFTENQYLHVEAEKNNEGKGGSKYSKIVYFPTGVSSVSAKLEDGILTVTVPKEKIKKDRFSVEIK
jgi:HSP20 family protein